MDKNTELIIKQTIAIYSLLLEYLKINNESLIRKFIEDNALINGICYHWQEKYSISYLKSDEILKLGDILYISHKLTNGEDLIPNTMIKEATEKRIEHLKKLL
jgi:hypothetical protein